MTTTLVVLGLDEKQQGEEVFDLITDKLTKQNLIKPGDAALVWRDLDGKTKIQQAMNPTAPGTAGGALWGTLIGTLLQMPAFGPAKGAATGAIASRLTDVGIDDKMIKGLGDQLKPGKAAVFALIVDATPDKAVAALKPFHPTVLQANLTNDDQAVLVRALQN